MKIANLTPHAVRIQSLDGELVEIEPSGVVARIAMTRRQAEPVGGFGVVAQSAPGGDAAAELDRVIREALLHHDAAIVSAMVLDHVSSSHAPYVFAPDTSPGSVIRDSAGRITGVRGLIQRADGARMPAPPKPRRRRRDPARFGGHLH